MLSASVKSSTGSVFRTIGAAFYHANVDDHFSSPRNTGVLNEKDEDVGTGIVGAPACGDTLQFQIKVDKNTNKIKEVKFLAFGCPAAVASSSLATTLVEGKTLDEALQVKNTMIANELNLPPVKLHCSMLAQDAIRSAVESYKKKHSASNKA